MSPAIFPLPPHRLSVAPMLDWTDRHCRYFHRLLCKRCLLFTEMITAPAILLGKNPERYLNFHSTEKPLAIQLGGDDPEQLGRCARIAEQWGYDEVNLNVGCPSPRVTKGNFGASLMAEPQLVGEIMDAIGAATALPISVKHRIGIDHMDDYETLAHFIHTVSTASRCQRFIVHARKAWLKGLSPAENRTIPPLSYPMVYRLKQDFPHLDIIVNGGVESLDTTQEHLRQVDGVMIGRAAYHNPWLLAEADARIFAEPGKNINRLEVLQQACAYAATLDRPQLLTRHMLGFFHSRPGARQWRRILGESRTSRTPIEDALAALPPEALCDKEERASH